MKINWFKITDINICITSKNALIHDEFNNFLNYITIGPYCEDCMNAYWECNCNIYENENLEFILNWIIYNLSQFHIRLLINSIKRTTKNFDKLKEKINYLENKLV